MRQPSLPVVAILGLVAVATQIGFAQGYIIPVPPGPMPRPPAPLSVKYHRVHADIADQVAGVKIDQVFVNQHRRQMEGTYYFPLPEAAAVSDFALYIDGKRVEGEVLDKDTARKIYEDIVRRMEDPALLEHAGSGLFRARVFPIPAGGERRIELGYTQHIPFESGTARFTYPLKSDKPNVSPVKELTLDVALNTKVALKSVYSPTHDVDVVRKGDHRAVVSFEQSNVKPERDFALYYTVSEAEFGLNLLTHRERGDDGFFLLMLAPKQEYEEAELIAKDIVFVCDTSGSMTKDDKIGQARDALEFCLANLNARDRFAVISFATAVRRFEDELAPATDGNVRRARDFVRKIKARGGTNINEALSDAVGMIETSSRPTMIVFLTDGRPTVGVTEIEKILDNISDANRVARARSRPLLEGVLSGVFRGGRTVLAADDEGDVRRTRVSLDLRERDIVRALQLISKATEVSFVVAPEVSGRVTYKCERERLDRVLDDLAEMCGFEWEATDDTILVRAKGARRPEPPEDGEGQRAVVVKPRGRRARVFVFGVGHDVNTHLLDKLADQNGGSATYVEPHEDIELAVSAFYTKISHPVLSDLQLRFGDIKVYDTHPLELPDLFRGSQLTVLGRYEGRGETDVTLIGQVAGKQRAFEYAADFPRHADEHDFIPRLWAQRKIGYLLDEIRLHGEKRELKEAIVDLSLEYGIVTPYTSYLVQEDERIARRPGFRPLAEAVGQGHYRASPAAPALSAGANVAMPADRARAADLQEAAGEGGFRAARVTKQLRGAEQVQRGQAVQYVARRTMYLDRDAWRQVQRDSIDRTVEIKYASRAYFDVLRARPDWGPLFGLGASVEFQSGRQLIRIGPAGRETLSEEELRELTARS